MSDTREWTIWACEEGCGYWRQEESTGVHQHFRDHGAAQRHPLEAIPVVPSERLCGCEERLREAERLLRETLNAFVAAYGDDDPTPETIDRLANAMGAARGFLGRTK